MRDNTVFFVGTDASLGSVRDAVSSICGLGHSIVLVAAQGYEWDDASDHRNAVMLQWHRYSSGDLVLELEVLFGGDKLVCGDGEQLSLSRLAKLLQVVVTEPLEVGLAAMHKPDGTISHVGVWMPDNYGTAGPRLLSNK